MAVDPVCGIHVDEKTAVPPKQYTSKYEGETLYFCSADCKKNFDNDPEQYMEKSA
jgi:P-type Cu+ transporter